MPELKYRGFQLHPAQQQIRDNKSRFKTVCCGRRFGKTFYVVDEIAGFIFPESEEKEYKTRGWVVAPTYKQTEEIEVYFRISFAELIAHHNRNERIYTLTTGDVIEFKSADSLLKGAGLDWIIIDEAAQVPDIVWYEHLRPTLIDRKGKAVFISTPKGRNWFYEVFVKGQDPTFTSYASFQFETQSNPHLDPEEFEELIRDMPQLTYDQEIRAKFLDDASAFFRNVDACITDTADYNEALETRFDCQRCGHTFRVREQDLWYYDEEGKHPVTSVRCNACRAYNDRNYRKDSPIYFKGVDTANSIDFNVISVVRWHPKAPRIRLVALDRFNQVSWNVKRERIKEAHQRFPGALYLESNFDGGASAEALQYEGIPAVAVTMTNRTKAAILNRLAILIERGLIEFPAGLPNLQALLHELKIFESKQTEGGTWKFSAPEGKHDDCVISLALAVSQVPICGLEPVNLKTKKEEEAE